MSTLDYIKPSEIAVDTIVVVREKLKDVESVINDTVPNCREKSLAITKLEEVYMWINKAIVLTK